MIPVFLTAFTIGVDEAARKELAFLATAEKSLVCVSELVKSKYSPRSMTNKRMGVNTNRQNRVVLYFFSAVAIFLF